MMDQTCPVPGTKNTGNDKKGRGTIKGGVRRAEGHGQRMKRTFCPLSVAD